MSQRYEKLQHLISLAHESSSDKRRELLREVTDLFMHSPATLSEKESGQFGQIMNTLAFQLEMTVRENLAERLADVDTAPRDLIRNLANDAIQVAQPILERSGVLQNEDLIEIVKNHSQEHLVAISLREEVSEEIADHLVERGNDQVLETLVRNEGARLSRTAQETIVTRAETNESLHEPLVKRQDMAPDLMHQMYFVVSTALRQHILENTADMDEATVDQLLEDAREQAVRHIAEEERELTAAERFVRDKERQGQLQASLLLQLLHQGDKPTFAAGFARICEIDTRTAQRILFRGDGEAIAVACRATGIDRTMFANFVQLLGHTDGATGESLSELLQIYDKIPEQSAKRAMRFWRTREQAMKTKESVINR